MWIPKELVVQCPVCNRILGKKNDAVVFTAHCEECRATFYWKPWTNKPSVIMDRNQPKTCGCHVCRPEDKKEEK